VSPRFDIAQRRLAEQALGLAAELTWTFMADFEGRAGCIKFASSNESKVFLILKGTHRRNARQ